MPEKWCIAARAQPDYEAGRPCGARTAQRAIAGVQMRHLVFGTILIVLGLWGLFAWWSSFAMVVRAIVPLGLVVIGLLAVLSSYYRLAGSEPAEGDTGEE